MLAETKQFRAAKDLLRETISDCGHLNEDNPAVISTRLFLARLLRLTASSRGEQREAVTILEDVEPRCRRVYGAAHPESQEAQDELESARRMLAMLDARAAAAPKH